MTAHSHTRTRLMLNEAELLQKLPFLRNKVRVRGAKAEGIRYERKAQAYLEELFGEYYLPSPWIAYYEDGLERYCQPDGLIFNFLEGRITIIEIKLKHTADAYVQIKSKYAPRIREMFPSHLWKLSACEVVRWYDPHTYFPEDAVLTKDIGRLTPEVFGVHIFTSRRRSAIPR